MQSLNPEPPTVLVLRSAPHGKQEMRPNSGWNVAIWHGLHGFNPEAENVPWSHSSEDKMYQVIHSSNFKLHS